LKAGFFSNDSVTMPWPLTAPPMQLAVHWP